MYVIVKWKKNLSSSPKGTSDSTCSFSKPLLCVAWSCSTNVSHWNTMLSSGVQLSLLMKDKHGLHFPESKPACVSSGIMRWWAIIRTIIQTWCGFFMDMCLSSGFVLPLKICIQTNHFKKQVTLSCQQISLEISKAFYANITDFCNTCFTKMDLWAGPWGFLRIIRKTVWYFVHRYILKSKEESSSFIISISQWRNNQDLQQDKDAWNVIMMNNLSYSHYFS